MVSCLKAGYPKTGRRETLSNAPPMATIGERQKEEGWGGTMRYRLASFGIFSAILASSAWAGLMHPAQAQDVTIPSVTMTVGFGAGERPDLYGRILGRSLVRFLPGHPSLLAPAALSPSMIGSLKRSPMVRT